MELLSRKPNSMQQHGSHHSLTLTAVLLCVLTGCYSNLAPVKPPRIDVVSATNGMLAMFDTDQDGALDKSEANACQALTDQWDRYDVDSDGSATREEIQARFEKWTAGDTGMMNLRADVYWRGKPLADAIVKLTPYDFLGDNVLPAEGATDRYGSVFLTIPKDLLPASQQGTHGMQVGLYAVQVTHPNVKIPSKYNTSTELSVDLSPHEANTGIRLSLK